MTSRIEDLFHEILKDKKDLIIEFLMKDLLEQVVELTLHFKGRYPDYSRDEILDKVFQVIKSGKFTGRE